MRRNPFRYSKLWPAVENGTRPHCLRTERCCLRPRQRLAEESDSNRRWAKERLDIKSRVEKVLSDIEVLEGFEERKEVAFD